MNPYRWFHNIIGFGSIAISILIACSSCSHDFQKAKHFDISLKKQQDAQDVKTLETTLTVTPEKAALHPEYQILEKIAVPYVPEYRIGPGDIIEIVYHINYQKTPEDYRLEVQDKISINFPFHPQFSCTVLIRTDGKITVPILGDVIAESKTPMQVADYLNRAYSKYLNNPSITVALEMFNVKIDELKKAITTAPRGQSKIASVGPDGWIAFPIIGGVQAEGFTRTQLEKIVNKEYAKTVRNLNATLNVLEIHHAKFYILGEVKGQGPYVMRTRMTLLDALAAAQVDTRRANFKEVVIFRNDGLERPVAYKVDLSSTLKKGYAFTNILVRPADIIYVPKTKLTSLNDLIEKVFTKGTWGVMPFTTTFSWGEKDLGGDGGYWRGN